MKLSDQIQQILGVPVNNASRLHGGMIGEVYRVDLADGEQVVAKVAGKNGILDIEGYMLAYLRQHSDLPVPDVLHSEPQLLLMTYIPGSSKLSSEVQRNMAQHLAKLHSITTSQFGHECDTVIGPLHQPNPPTVSWINFFREQRLLHMAKVALDSGKLPAWIYDRIQKFAQDLRNWIDEPPAAALIHGDIWTTNVLAEHGKITGFIDPAIYYAHPEIELAYMTLFGAVGQAFFQRYEAFYPIEAGFFETRRDIYNLYPLLVHVRLFGGGYAQSVSNILMRLGY